MPTILDATNLTVPETSAGKKRIASDGRSILPSLLGQKQKDPALLFFHHARGKAIRTGNWKLVFNKDNKKQARWELYDLAIDPNELIDLANRYPEKVTQLSKLWQEREKNQLERGRF